jgi:hypothetical protein
MLRVIDLRFNNSYGIDPQGLLAKENKGKQALIYSTRA